MQKVFQDKSDREGLTVCFFFSFFFNSKFNLGRLDCAWERTNFRIFLAAKI